MKAYTDPYLSSDRWRGTDEYPGRTAVAFELIADHLAEIPDGDRERESATIRSAMFPEVSAIPVSTRPVVDLLINAAADLAAARRAAAARHPEPVAGARS